MKPAGWVRTRSYWIMITGSEAVACTLARPDLRFGDHEVGFGDHEVGFASGSVEKGRLFTCG